MAPTTMMCGARRYLLRVFCTFTSFSFWADITLAMVSPSTRRDSPLMIATRAGQVRLWFGAHMTASHSCWRLSRDTTVVGSIRRLLRRRRISAASSCDSTVRSVLVQGAVQAAPRTRSSDCLDSACLAITTKEQAARSAEFATLTHYAIRVFHQRSSCDI